LRRNIEEQTTKNEYELNEKHETSFSYCASKVVRSADSLVRAVLPPQIARTGLSALLLAAVLAAGLQVAPAAR